MTEGHVAGSFRDPHGFVFASDGVVHRQVAAEGAADYDHFMASGLYDVLVGDGLLVAHDEVADPRASGSPVGGAVPHRILRPTQIPFISYPYEWCFGQLKAAALATLRIQGLALEHGMSLRDASAYNIQFLDGRAILIDTLSFEPLVEGRPWVAYRQFCQHFLAPLALASLVDPALLTLARVQLDGVPLPLASRLLPGRTKLTPSLALHLHAHARSQRRHAGETAAASSRRGFSQQAFRGLIDSVRGAVERLDAEPAPSVWVDYYDAAASYTAAAAADKERAVAELVAEVAPATVFDLGANTGRFSRLAASQGARVVALEQDHEAVEAHWRALQTAGGDAAAAVLPLVCDLANPSPALGWAHTERVSLTARGPADLVLALALVHHLAIAGNVPLERIAAWLAQLGQWALVEFVPKSDPMVTRLLATREDIFPDYSADDFDGAFGRHFTTKRRVELAGSERTLHLLQASR